MPLANDRCICLRKTEYSETSQVVTLFSRQYGLFRAIAKGAHRRTKAGHGKFDGGMDYLEIGDAVFIHDPSKDLATLTEWTLLEGHLALRGNLRAMFLSLYVAEITSFLFEEHDAHPNVFDRLLATVAQLQTPRREQYFLAYELDLLREAGYLPELGMCVSCGRSMRGLEPDDYAYFSCEKTGVICRACEAFYPDRLSLDPSLLRLVQGFVHLLGQPGSDPATWLPQLSRRETDPINHILARHIERTIGKQLRSARYVVESVALS